MFNPDVISRCPVPWADAHRWLAVHGFDWWSDLCDVVPTGRWLTIRDMVQRLDIPMTDTNVRYTRLVLAYIREESGDEVVQRSGNRYRFV